MHKSVRAPPIKSLCMREYTPIVDYWTDACCKISPNPISNPYVDCRIFSQLISILSEKIRSWTNVLLAHRPEKLEPGHLCAPLVIEPELRYITSIPIIFIFVFFEFDFGVSVDLKMI